MLPTLLLALPATWVISPWLSLAFSAWWLLPDWVDKWLDVRDRWHRQ
jgi:hypothetical protein